MPIINTSKYLDFKSAISPSGHDWYYVKRTNDKPNLDSAVAITTIVKINDEYNFLFMKTNRPPITSENKAKYCLESPAGLIADIDKDETLLECTKKELLEETGLIADEIYIELKNSSTSAGLSSETLTYITAICNSYNIIQKPVSDGGVIQERFFIPINNVSQYLKTINQKEISVAAALACGVYYALERINSR